MKSFILAAMLFVVAVPLRAQITLEHKYRNVGIFGIVQVDSGEWKYVNCNQKDSITIYNIDHSLDRVIIYPPGITGSLFLLSRRLFDLDSGYEYVVSGNRHLSINKEDGTVLFSCDTCYIGSYTGLTNDPMNQSTRGIKSTPQGSKMIIDRFPQTSYETYEIYSLPGRLPGSSQMLTVGGDPSNPNYALATLAAYPNPSQGRVRIAYDLPSGITSGEIVLTTSDGREVMRYHITNAFSDLLVEEGDLPAGSYFYKVVTARGESPVQRIVREK